jgi:hypothetical protein
MFILEGKLHTRVDIGEYKRAVTGPGEPGIEARFVFGIFIPKRWRGGPSPSQRLFLFNKSVVTLSCAPHSVFILHMAFLTSCLSGATYRQRVS